MMLLLFFLAASTAQQNLYCSGDLDLDFRVDVRELSRVITVR